jgi:hypothetical protein
MLTTWRWSGGGLLPSGAALVEYGGLRALPAFSEDDEPTSGGRSTRSAIRLFRRTPSCATPEYNASIPGALKNALDWASRPTSDAALLDKPDAVIGASGHVRRGVGPGGDGQGAPSERRARRRPRAAGGAGGDRAQVRRPPGRPISRVSCARCWQLQAGARGIVRLPAAVAPRLGGGPADRGALDAPFAWRVAASLSAPWRSAGRWAGTASTTLTGEAVGTTRSTRKLVHGDIRRRLAEQAMPATWLCKPGALRNRAAVTQRASCTGMSDWSCLTGKHALFRALDVVLLPECRKVLVRREDVAHLLAERTFRPSM